VPGEKTEKATPKRKEEERKKGNIFLSQEVVTVFTLIATFYTVKIMMPYMISTIEASISHFINLAAVENSLTYGTLSECFITMLIIFAKCALIPLLVCCLIAVVATMGQTKMLFSTKTLAFKADRINPIQGFKKMFSIRSVVEIFKSILKIGVLIYVIYTILKKEMNLLPRMIDMSFTEVASKTGSIIMEIVIKAGAVFILLAGADFIYQWWQYEKNLRMSKQEIKDEYKQTEGDPQIKNRIRSLQMQRAKQRMMQKVPDADVVIRNPTHFAVAIKYDQKLNRAPLVVAKGADNLALMIVKVAEENGVYVTENRPLARALYESVDLDREVPEQFYRAIAEVLAFVYNLKKKGFK
jgi:flagellar biosynthesis protein FlhB